MLRSLTASVSPKIVNYSDAYFISISNGHAATYENNSYMIHRTNLTDYERIINENEELFEHSKTNKFIDCFKHSA